VNYITDFKEKGKWFIVFEYCGKGDLEHYAKSQGKLPEEFCKNLAYSVIQALSLLHEKGIAHRDLKLSNILINDEYDFKIADFGLAKAGIDGILVSCCGTPFSMAP
jgi:serine/threonine protein kinase